MDSVLIDLHNYMQDQERVPCPHCEGKGWLPICLYSDTEDVIVTTNEELEYELERGKEVDYKDVCPCCYGEGSVHPSRI